MKAPAFWFTPPDRPGWRARLLSPLGRLYAAATARRLRQAEAHRAGVPVICIGNLSAGGTGKTPLVIALAERLRARGVAAHVVSRGYGGRTAGPVRVDPATQDARTVGDEPLLMAAFAPVWVARNRVSGARAATDAGAQAILLDDGFQNPDPVKDFSVIVVDAVQGFGNGLCLPAGPLREPVDVGLRRADIVLLVGRSEQREAFLRIWSRSVSVPVATGELAPLRTGMIWSGLRVLAFAGIGRPAKFFESLRAAGADIVRAEALDDHQPLSPALLKRLSSEALSLGAELVTTEKDAARLPADIRSEILVFPVRLAIDDWSAFDAHLTRLGL